MGLMPLLTTVCITDCDCAAEGPDNTVQVWETFDGVCIVCYEEFCRVVFFCGTDCHVAHLFTYFSNTSIMSGYTAKDPTNTAS